MPIYASEDQDLITGIPPSAASAAVEFSGTSGPNGRCALVLQSLSGITDDVGFISFAGWFKTPLWGISTSYRSMFWIIDPWNQYVTFFWNTSSSGPSLQFEDTVEFDGLTISSDSFPDGAAQSFATYDVPFGPSTDHPMDPCPWVHIMASGSVNNHFGSAATMYINDVNCVFFLDGGGATNSNAIAYNGAPFWFGDDGFGSGYSAAMRVFDFSWWPGVNFMSAPNIIPLATRRLFINALGQPVPPSVAIAALGKPAVFLTGGLPGFLANNNGYAGSLEIPTAIQGEYGPGTPTAFDSPIDVPGVPYGSTSATRAYNPTPVQFTGNSGTHGKCGISLPSLSCTDNGKFSFAGWFKLPNWDELHETASVEAPAIFVAHSTTLGCSWVRAFTPGFGGAWRWPFYIYNSGLLAGTGFDPQVDELSDVSVDANFISPPGHNARWMHFMGTVDAHPSSGLNTLSDILENTIDVQDNSISENVTTFFTAPLNGFPFWFGDDGDGNSCYMEVADFSFWPGVSWWTADWNNYPTHYISGIPMAVRRCFINDNCDPINPSTTISMMHALGYGPPAVMLTGGVSGFLANTNGTSGALSVPSGYDSPIASSSTPVNSYA